MYVKPNSMLDLLEMTVLATAVAGLLYFGYFQLAPWIWSQNLTIDPADIPPWYLAELEERDGIELYALYALMFINLLSAYALTLGLQRLPGKSDRYLLVLALVVACAFIGSIGFHPPLNTFASRAPSEIFAQSLTVSLVILPIIGLLYHLQQRSTYWALSVAGLFLIPVCFISTAPIEWYDYAYILAPALRLLHGARISEIYFQYDLLLSLIGLAWMKLRLDLNSFQVVGQCSYYLFLLGVFAFSRQWFLDKRLPVFLLIAAVLVRIYAGPAEAVHSFQVTPLRLDLWLILLTLVYLKGPHHWSAGLFCGLMLILHNDFGIIYSAAYIQLLVTLRIINRITIPGQVIRMISTNLNTFIKENYRNLTLILGCALAHYLMFRNANAPNDFNYVRIGFDFIRITSNSFYWYMVVVSGLSFVLLMRWRSMVSSRYLAAGFSLIYLVIGNSLYFFGRSHENNIINISIILLLLFFMLIDISGRLVGGSSDGSTKPFMNRNLAIVASLIFVTSISVWYGDSINEKATTQARNVAKGQFIYPSEVPEQDILNTLAEVKAATGGNPKVFFVGDNDFLLNYYGGFVPLGYYNPVYAWISRREFSKFLRELLDQGYYVVIDNGLARDVLSSVNITGYRYIQGRVVAWK